MALESKSALSISFSIAESVSFVILIIWLTASIKKSMFRMRKTA